jgi:predicted NBD/HSP70 family sugar kinase
VIDSRQQELMRTLWLQGPLSRWELHEQTKLSPNGVGTLVDAMLRAGLISECAPEPKHTRLGRPRVPLEIDPLKRHVLGLAIVPGRAEIVRLGLTGAVHDRVHSRDVSNPSTLVKAAAALLKSSIDEQTLAVGVTVTGFIDPVKKNILFSSALPGRPVESLAPVFAAAGDRPAVLGNDMHALAGRWLLTHRAEQRQDVLLVWFADGRLGSALLIDGRPNRGCTTGGNELGHTRFFVETAPCFCGQTGCLERIVSSDFLLRRDRANPRPSDRSNHNGAPTRAGHPPEELETPVTTDRSISRSGASMHSPLAMRVARFDPSASDRSLDDMLTYLSCSLANAANFIRPHRLVLVSPFARNPAFAAALAGRTQSQILPDLTDHVRIDFWDQSSAGSAENAAWLALAELLYGGWDAAGTKQFLSRSTSSGQ